MKLIGKSKIYFSIKLPIFFVAIFLFSLMFAKDVKAAQLRSISGTSWPTSGVASTSTTGFSECSGFTHVGSTDLPLSSIASGYIETANDAGGYIKIDNPATIPFQGSEKDYWIRFWIRPIRTATALAANGTNSAMWTQDSGTTLFRMTAYVANLNGIQSVTLANQSWYAGGINSTMVADNSQSVYGRLLPFGEWTEMAFHLKLDSTNGVIESYVNGTLYYRLSGIITDGGTTQLALSDARSKWRMNFPAWNGVKWQVASPISSWSQNDISIRPNYGLVKQSSWMTKFLGTDFQNLPQGSLWNTNSSTATSTITQYSTGGVNNFRKRFIGSGLSGQTLIAQSYDNLGTPPYNEQGWASYVWEMVYLPGGATGSFKILKTDGSTLMQLDVDGTHLKQGSTTLAPWNAADRYAIAIHLSNSGQATFTIHDETASAGSETVWSGPLNNWTPQDLGPVRSDIALGSANVELDGVSVWKWMMWAGLDSLTNASANGVTPSLSAVNHVTASLPSVGSIDSIPNSEYSWRSFGVPFRPVGQITGRSGTTRAQFTANVLPYFNYTHGLCFLNVDGGSINDINAINNNDPYAVVNTLTNQTSSMLTSLLANGNKVWLTTMINRVQGTFTTNEKQGILNFNTAIQNLASSKQTIDDGVIFSDVAANIADHSTMFSAGDDTHFNSAGDKTYAKLLLTTATVPIGDFSAPTTTASISTGTYTQAQTVTLTCDDGSGVGCDKTYYTTDNSTPTTSSTQYTTPIQINSTTTLKFFSQDKNNNQESIQTKTYTIEIPTPVITPAPILTNISNNDNHKDHKEKKLTTKQKFNKKYKTTKKWLKKQTTKFNRNLSLGSQGNDVGLLQQALQKMGLMKIKDTTYGVYKSITQQAVAKLQQFKNISPTGVFGWVTRGLFW